MISPLKSRMGRCAVGLVLTAIVLATLSCDPGDIFGDGELSPEDQAATVQALINEQLATLQAPSDTPGPTEMVEPPDCSGATFDLGASVAASVSYELAPASEGEMLDPVFAIPEHVQYSFQGYVLPDTFHEPVIHIYPVDEYVALVPSVADTVASLQQLLNDKPAVPPDGIPFLPRWNAAQMIRAKIGYVDFQNGSGIRFLTQYGQAYWLINNHDMFYAFQGLTNGGECYISAILPVSNPALPAEGAPPPGETEAQIIAYFDLIVPQLNAMLDGSFVPSLTTLDAMIASMEVE